MPAPLDVAVLHREPCGGGYVFEHSFAKAAIERRDVIGEMRLDDVEVPVGVEIGDRQAHARLRHAVLAERGAALKGDVGEGAVPVVAIQDGRRGIGRDVDIRPAVLDRDRPRPRSSVAVSGRSRCRRPPTSRNVPSRSW